MYKMMMMTQSCRHGSNTRIGGCYYISVQRFCEGIDVTLYIWNLFRIMTKFPVVEINNKITENGSGWNLDISLP